MKRTQTNKISFWWGVLLLALIVIGCGKKTSVQEKGNEYPIPQVQVKRPLCIKGFSLGMSKANARMALNNNGLYLHDTNYSDRKSVV